MSYKCTKCNETCFHTELKKVTNTREVTYNKNVPRFNRDTRKKEFGFLEAYKGWEIVDEGRYCQTCYDSIVNDIPAIEKQKIVDFNFIPPRVDEDKKKNESVEDNEKNR